MDWHEILKWAAGAIAALVAGGIVIKLTFNRKHTATGDVRITTQNNNKAGGDIIGGDSTKKTGK